MDHHREVKRTRKRKIFDDFVNESDLDSDVTDSELTQLSQSLLPTQKRKAEPERNKKAVKRTVSYPDPPPKYQKTQQVVGQHTSYGGFKHSSQSKTKGPDLCPRHLDETCPTPDLFNTGFSLNVHITPTRRNLPPLTPSPVQRQPAQSPLDLQIRRRPTTHSTLLVTPRRYSQHNTSRGRHDQHRSPESSQMLNRDNRLHDRVLNQSGNPYPRLTSDTMRREVRHTDHRQGSGRGLPEFSPMASASNTRRSYNEQPSVRRRIPENFSRPSGRTERVESQSPVLHRRHSPSPGQSQRTPQSASRREHRSEDAVKRWSANATDSEIEAPMAEHLKHAPGRAGGGGYKK
ncbi:uncharacterized protein Hap1MRO34_002906 [Clarias gariepinus]